jgi:hypothetical protein
MSFLLLHGDPTDALFRQITQEPGVLRVARYTLLMAPIEGKPSYLAYSDLHRFYQNAPFPLWTALPPQR